MSYSIGIVNIIQKTPNLIGQKIPYDELKKGMLGKYALTINDIDYALNILTAFFVEKMECKTNLLILPQIADWAWHEFILNSEKYASFTYDVFGSNLPHMKITPDDDAYEATKRLFKEKYGLDTSIEFWEDSGWNSHSYKFKDKWRKQIDKLDESIQSKSIKLQEKFTSEFGNVEIDLEWLVRRISQRFLVTEITARVATSLYTVFLYRLMCKQNSAFEEANSLVFWAWQEHMLWTEKYKNDCSRIFGAFLHRPIVSESMLFNRW